MEVLAAIALGLGVGGIAMLARRLAGGLIPRAAVPAAAGLAMLGFAVWSEYSWFERQAASLPAGMTVVSSVRESSSWRPWTWAAPYVTRFAAVDVAGARRNDRLPGHVMANVYLFARHAPPAVLPQIVDCAGGRRAELTGDVGFDESGRPEGVRWIDLTGDDPLHRALCGDARTTFEG